MAAGKEGGASPVDGSVAPAIGGAQLSSVDGSMLNTLYGELLTGGRTSTRRGKTPGLAPKTVRNLRGLRSKAFADAVRWARIAWNPCHAADPPRGQGPEMKVWTADQLRAFSTAVASHRWAGPWALVATPGCGAAKCSACGGRTFDLEAGTVSVRSTRIRYSSTVATSTPKTARGNRTIAIGPATVAALKAWRRAQAEERLLMGAGWQDRDGLIVTLPDGTAPNPESFSNLFKKLAARAGLPRIRLYDLRHSYAAAALASDVHVTVVSERIGHADIGVTLKVYAHVLPGADEAAARRADELLGGSVTKS